jgi:hypothetical protein
MTTAIDEIPNCPKCNMPTWLIRVVPRMLPRKSNGDTVQFTQLPTPQLPCRSLR